jgi:hypothetical protein
MQNFENVKSSLECSFEVFCNRVAREGFTGGKLDKKVKSLTHSEVLSLLKALEQVENFHNSLTSS